MCSTNNVTATKTYPVKVKYTNTTISMLSSTGTKLTLQRPIIETPTLAWIMDNGKLDTVYQLDLTADEMAEFKSLVQAQQARVDYVAQQVKATRLETPVVLVDRYDAPKPMIVEKVKEVTPVADPVTVNLKPVKPKHVVATTYTNDKTGHTVKTVLSKQQILDDYLENSTDDNWLWFWLAKSAEDRRMTPCRKDMISFLQDSFLFAIGMGLKKPMIRLHYGNRRYKVYLSKRGSLCFKSGAVHPTTKDPVGDEEYVGCLYAGRFLVNKNRAILADEQHVIDQLSLDPVGFLATTSKDMSRCCYCGKPLEDKRSKDVGYGETCAAHWGLPWGKSYDEKVPSFAQLWANSGTSQRDMRAVCQAIRSNPWDELNWQAFGDILEEVGFQKRPKMPARTTTIPAA